MICVFTRPSHTYNGAIMARRRSLIITFVSVYLFGIATPYLVRYAAVHAARSVAGVREVSRTTSPDGVLDAVVMQYNPGAFSSFIYELYLVPRGAKVTKLSGDPAIVHTSEGDALVASWVKPHFLSVIIGNSHVTFFGNLWYSNRVPDYYVELTFTNSGKHYLQENGKIRGQQ